MAMMNQTDTGGQTLPPYLQQRTPGGTNGANTTPVLRPMGSGVPMPPSGGAPPLSPVAPATGGAGPGSPLPPLSPAQPPRPPAPSQPNSYPQPPNGPTPQQQPEIASRLPGVSTTPLPQPPPLLPSSAVEPLRRGDASLPSGGNATTQQTALSQPPTRVQAPLPDRPTPGGGSSNPDRPTNNNPGDYPGGDGNGPRGYTPPPPKPDVSAPPPTSPGGDNGLQDTFNYFKGELENQRNRASSSAVADASARGVYYGTPLTTSQGDIETSYLKGLGSLEANMYNASQSNELGRLALATQLTSGMPMTSGGNNSATTTLLGQLFGGGNSNPMQNPTGAQQPPIGVPQTPPPVTPAVPVMPNTPALQSNQMQNWFNSQGAPQLKAAQRNQPQAI